MKMADHPDADLIAQELDLEVHLVGYAETDDRLCCEPNILDCGLLHERHAEVLEHIVGLRAGIAGARPATLAGAAVQLRRALAAIEGHDCRDPHRRDGRAKVPLLRSVLAVVEGAAA